MHLHKILATDSCGWVACIVFLLLYVSRFACFLYLLRAIGQKKAIFLPRFMPLVMQSQYLALHLLCICIKRLQFVTGCLAPIGSFSPDLTLADDALAVAVRLLRCYAIHPQGCFGDSQVSRGELLEYGGY